MSTVRKTTSPPDSSSVGVIELFRSDATNFPSIGAIERFYRRLIDMEPDVDAQSKLRAEMTLSKTAFREAKIQKRYDAFGPSTGKFISADSVIKDTEHK